MSDLDLCYMPASEALKRFKAKKLSPVELMEAVIKRAEATKDKVNAFTNTHFDEAMDLAKKAEAKYAKGKKTGALEGLPIGIKDESYIKGKPTTGGSLIMKDFVADSSSTMNERVIKAGGIVHARTATPEFSCAAYTWSRLWGITRNPWNTKFTPGGSSGGAGASLASGTSSIATGSDIGGSIRIPASTCGVVGYKPPYGRNPDDPPFNLDFYCHTGPLARTVEDAILLQNVMTGPSPLDIASLRPKLTLPTKFKPIKGWKIGYSMNLGGFEVDPEVVKNTKKALDVFRSLGAEVEEVDLGWGPEVLEAGMAYLNHLFGAFLSKLLPEHADEMTTYARKFAEDGAGSKATDFVNSLEVAGRMYMTLGPLLEKYNVLICPTTALPSVPADHDQSKDEVRINGKLVNPSLGWVMTTPFNTMSRCPVLSLPSGHAKNGVPTGIQIVGRTYCDEDVFRAGMAYEKAVGGWYGEKAKRPKL
ncbi:amidase [Mesorhizobium sp. CGMCC 1.15528]|uniref:Indoleacetamide hydrolase n=1 Tax=Mesorhizobium zhangyense TaxID=1776730 RepID=A0A7C9VCE6_9HYPH|nr:amidase [Mesorhizobium zhangyense]NGN41088.1 amidase [Mesorhizobium zhangyense]